MNAKVCDGCGEVIYDAMDITSYRIQRYDPGYGGFFSGKWEKLDVCSGCGINLIDFMDTIKTKKKTDGKKQE